MDYTTTQRNESETFLFCSCAGWLFFFSSLRIFIGLNLHLTLILAAGRSPASICCLRLLISWANTFLSSSRSLRWRRASSVLTITSTSFRSQFCKYNGHQSVENTELAEMHKQSVQCRLHHWTNFTLSDYGAHMGVSDHTETKFNHLDSCSSPLHSSVLDIFTLLCHLTSLLQSVFQSLVSSCGLWGKSLDEWLSGYTWILLYSHL